MAIVAGGFDVTECRRAAAAIEADLLQLANTLTEAQFHAPPRGGGWSIGYCVEHLVLSGKAFLPTWDAALGKAARNKSGEEAALPYTWWQRKILHFVENPARLRHKSPALLAPCSRRSIDETVGRFLDMHRELVRRLDASRSLDLRHSKVQSPFVSWLSFELGFSFDLCLAHERRHLSQAWRVSREVKAGNPTV